VLPAAGPVSRRPLPPRGSRRSGSPAFRGTKCETLRLPERRLDRLPWWFRAGPLLPPRASVFDPPAGPNASPGAGPIGCAAPGRSFNEEERQGSLQFPHPWCAYGRVWTPAGTLPHWPWRKSRGPAFCQQRGLTRGRQSRGSIARPEHCLSTLSRPSPLRAETQDLLFPGPGPGLPVWIGYPRVATKGFSNDVSYIPLPLPVLFSDAIHLPQVSGCPPRCAPLPGAHQPTSAPTPSLPPSASVHFTSSCVRGGRIVVRMVPMVLAVRYPRVHPPRHRC